MYKMEKGKLTLHFFHTSFFSFRQFEVRRTYESRSVVNDAKSEILENF